MRFETAFVEFLHKLKMLSGSDAPLKHILVDKPLYDRITLELLGKTQYESYAVGSNGLRILDVEITRGDI